MVVPFAIRMDSRPMRLYEAIYRSLLKEKNWQHIWAIKDRSFVKILLYEHKVLILSTLLHFE